MPGNAVKSLCGARGWNNSVDPSPNAASPLAKEDVAKRSAKHYCKEAKTITTGSTVFTKFREIRNQNLGEIFVFCETRNQNLDKIFALLQKRDDF